MRVVGHVIIVINTYNMIYITCCAGVCVRVYRAESVAARQPGDRYTGTNGS